MFLLCLDFFDNKNRFIILALRQERLDNIEKLSKTGEKLCKKKMY